MKRQVLTIAVCLISFVIAPLGFILFVDYSIEQYFRPYGDRGQIYQTKEISNGNFKIKIDAHDETGVYMPGTYFVLSSASCETCEWNEIAWSKSDGQPPIDERQFHFINEKSGYFANDQIFAVSVDAGHTWSVWKPEVQLKIWPYSFKSIEDVRIDPHGNGSMRLTPFSERSQTPEFQTNDFGQNWRWVKNGESN